jgi:DNA-binding transcriptional ArsR family regulator
MADDKSRATAEVRTPSPTALKAFTHPLRMAIFSELGRHGSATASQLGRTLGESSGQTSYHLRQLERHGFVEDDPEHTGGRERWWRAVGFTLGDDALRDHPETLEYYDLMIRHTIAERAAALTSWLEQLDPRQTEEAGLLSQSSLELTDDEATRLAEEITVLVRSYADLAEGRTGQPGFRRYRVHADVFPLGGPATD